MAGELSVRKPKAGLSNMNELLLAGSFLPRASRPQCWSRSLPALHC